MNKDFNQTKLLSFSEEKQLKVLFDLARFIEKNNLNIDDKSFLKLQKYHSFLEHSKEDKIQRMNKEFKKIVSLDKQFTLYLMLLERLLGQSSKEYDNVVKTSDNNNLKVKNFPIILILDALRSAHNVGAIIRNAECFGVSKIIFSGFTPTPDTEAVKKTAMGCEPKTWIETDDLKSTIQSLKNQGHAIMAIETGRDAKNINKITVLDEPIVLILGNEQYGIDLEILKLADEILHIPMHGQKNSLNVAVSSGIVLNKITDLLTR